MSALSIFAFGEQMVRISDRDGEPWFVGRDVCAALGHTNVSKSLSRIPDDEKGVTNGYTLGGDQTMIVISEPGMYRLVLTSRTEAAQRFKKWVVTDVLPAIRRTGKYAPAANDEPADDDTAMFDNGRVFGTHVRLGTVREARKLFGDDHARDLWRRVGLPAIRVLPPRVRAIAAVPAPAPPSTLHDQIVAANADKGFDDDWRAK